MRKTTTLKEELKNYINKIHKIPDKLLEEFLSLWSLKLAKRKEIITQVDSIDKYLYFTVKGVQKAYYITDGNEYIIAFTYPFAFTCIPESFLTQRTSNYCLECINSSEFLRISYTDFMDFTEKYPIMETLLRKKLINTLGGLVNRYHRLIAYSIEERYKDFMKNSPHLINSIPQKDIANYLKMDPTNFSKLINSVKL